MFHSFLKLRSAFRLDQKTWSLCSHVFHLTGTAALHKSTMVESTSARLPWKKLHVSLGSLFLTTSLELRYTIPIMNIKLKMSNCWCIKEAHHRPSTMSTMPILPWVPYKAWVCNASMVFVKTTLVCILIKSAQTAYLHTFCTGAPWNLLTVLCLRSSGC